MGVGGSYSAHPGTERPNLPLPRLEGKMHHHSPYQHTTIPRRTRSLQRQSRHSLALTHRRRFRRVHVFLTLGRQRDGAEPARGSRTPTSTRHGPLLTIRARDSAYRNTVKISQRKKVVGRKEKVRVKSVNTQENVRPGPFFFFSFFITTKK